MSRSKHTVHLFAAALLASAVVTGCAVARDGARSVNPNVPTEFRVRVGLYSSSGLAVARKVEDTLREAGHRAYMRRVNRETQGLYVGRRLSKEDADQLKRRIDRLLDTKTLVVAM